MALGRGEYFRALSQGDVLDGTYVDHLFEEMRSRLTLREVPSGLLRANEEQAKITEKLSRLLIRVTTGPRGWGGLVIGFPGTGRQLTTETLGTPYLREILYPILDLRRRISKHYGERLPCLYLLGVRFPEVVVNKFRLLELMVPHIVVLTDDLPDRPRPAGFPSHVNEQWVQVWLCRKMMLGEGLRVPVEKGDIRLGYVTHELSTGGGTHRRERLDILGVDQDDGALVVFEIKGPDCGRVQLENLFLQGLAHREWLELNKKAIKLIFDRPRGTRIDTRRRVRLVLGFFQEEVPELFWDMRLEAMQRDSGVQIDWVRLAHSGGLYGELKLTRKGQETAR